MSYKEKRIIVSVITGLIILAAYCIYTYGKYQSGAITSDNMKAWAGIVLVFIGIGVAASIVIIFNYTPAMMLNVMFISFSAGSVLEGLAQIIFYKRGITNG